MGYDRHSRRHRGILAVGAGNDDGVESQGHGKGAEQADIICPRYIHKGKYQNRNEGIECMILLAGLVRY